MLSDDYDVGTEVWSATSYKSLRDDALTAERWNRLHPDHPRIVPYVQRVLGAGGGPVVAVTDFVKLVVDQVAPWMPRPFIPSAPTASVCPIRRPALRRHFEVDAAHIVTAVLWGLFLQGELKAEAVNDAIRRYGIDPDLPDPRDADRDLRTADQ